ncbi:MAG: hypothetical protein ACTSSL_10820 [Candidatus Heimdallarchaeaceae archaeon]
MIRRSNLIIALILIATFTSFISLQTVGVNAEIYQLNNGDKFVYNYKKVYESNTNEIFFPDDNKENYAYKSVHFRKEEYNFLRAFNVTNTNLSSSYIEVFDVATGATDYIYYWNSTYYRWNSDGWYKDNSNEYEDIINYSWDYIIVK